MIKINFKKVSYCEKRAWDLKTKARGVQGLLALFFLFVAFSLLIFPLQASSGVPAFPGAEGSGALAKGGRGGVVCEVTNLNDSGSGSLRACAEMAGPRTVVFRVSGTIVLKSRIRIRDPYITIAGQTAPGGGIQITGKVPGTIPFGSGDTADNRSDLLRVETHDVVIRYLRLRPGYRAANGGGDGFPLNITIMSTASYQTHVENIIVDHVSVQWGANMALRVYDLVGGRRLQNVSVQNSIFAETLYGRGNMLVGASRNLPDYPTAGDEMGDIDFHRNLLSTTFGRVPLIGADGRWINNIFYNTDNLLMRVGGEKTDRSFFVDIIGNRFEHGPVHDSSSRGTYEIGVVKQESNPSEVYVVGNWGDRHGYDNHQMVGQPSSTGGRDDTASVASDLYRKDSPLPMAAVPVNLMGVDEIEDAILGTVGASRRLDCEGNWVFNRDAVDARVIEEGYRKRAQNFLVTHEQQVGGFPVLEKGEACVDTSGDGIPDAWMVRNGLSPTEAIGAEFHGTGYTFLELYLNGMQLKTESEAAPAAAPTGVSVQ